MLGSHVFSRLNIVYLSDGLVFRMLLGVAFHKVLDMLHEDSNAYPQEYYSSFLHIIRYYVLSVMKYGVKRFLFFILFFSPLHFS